MHRTTPAISEASSAVSAEVISAKAPMVVALAARLRIAHGALGKRSEGRDRGSVKLARDLPSSISLNQTQLLGSGFQDPEKISIRNHEPEIHLELPLGGQSPSSLLTELSSRSFMETLLVSMWHQDHITCHRGGPPHAGAAAESVCVCIDDFRHR